MLECKCVRLCYASVLGAPELWNSFAQCSSCGEDLSEQAITRDTLP